jgi:succinoglycan biosynthesis protein ExoM
MAVIDICICTFRRPAWRSHRLGPAAGGARGCRAPASSSSTTTTPRRARIGAGGGRQGRGGDHLSPRAGPQHLDRAQRGARGLDARYLAFLDDDETAEAGLASGALGAPCRGRGGGGAGPRRSGLSRGRARLDAAISVHATRPVHVRGEIRTGYTCNVLIDRAAARDPRPALRSRTWAQRRARTAIISRVIVLMGGRIDYAPDARVTEPSRRTAELFLAGAAALPDGHDPCGRPAAPSRRVALARGSRGGGQALACGLPCADPSQATSGWRAARRCGACCMPVSWRAWSGRDAPVIYGGRSRRVDP